MAKSDAVQHQYRLTLISPDNPFWELMLVQPQQYDDELMCAYDTLKERFKWHVDNSLHPKQNKYLVHLIYEGRTQWEVADMYKVDQSCVHKSVYGNLIYSGRWAGRRYGGSLTKLKKLLANDKLVIEALALIRERT